MERQETRIARYLLENYQSEPEHLWPKFPEDAIFRHSGIRKWYALCMEVSGRSLGQNSDETLTILNLKCGSALVGVLLQREDFLPAYHMNKNTWITVLLNRSVEDAEIFSLLDFSYQSVCPKFRKKPQHKEIQG
ncbi:MAG: MmcQ/YjbR family DNA-binding protein [Oscillospiraceae bacterium]|nr:MmcQ/YjbR family DNA-binding protein [Oscillospiraceae bacterium]